MQRNIEAPGKEWLNATQAAKWLGIGRKLFLIQAKELGVPSLKIGHRTYVWHWQDVYVMSIVMRWQRQPAIVEPPKTP